MVNDLHTCFELEQAKARYCRLMDTKNWAELAVLLAEDLVFDLTDGNPGAAPIVGRDAALEAVRASVGNAKLFTRFIRPNSSSTVIKHA